MCPRTYWGGGGWFSVSIIRSRDLGVDLLTTHVRTSAVAELIDQPERFILLGRHLVFRGAPPQLSRPQQRSGFAPAPEEKGQSE